MSPVCSGCRFRRGSPVLLAPCASAFFLAAVPWFRVCLSIFSLDKKHRRARPSRKVGRPTTVVAIRKGCSNSVCRLLFFWPAGRRAAKPGDAGEGVRSKGPTVRDADAGIWPYVLYVCCSLLDRPVQLIYAYTHRLFRLGRTSERAARYARWSFVRVFRVVFFYVLHVPYSVRGSRRLGFSSFSRSRPRHRV